MIARSREKFYARGEKLFLKYMGRRKQDAYRHIFFRSKLFTLLVAAGGILLFVNFARMMTRDHLVRREIARLEGEVDRMESEYRRLEETRNFFKTDFFREQENRKSLGYARVGEKVVVIEGFTQKIDGVRSEGKLSNPQKWWKYLFNIKS